MHVFIPIYTCIILPDAKILDKTTYLSFIINQTESCKADVPVVFLIHIYFFTYINKLN